MVRIRTGQMLTGRNTVEDIPTTVLLLPLTGGGRRRIGVSFAVAAVVGDGEKMDRIEIVKENHAVFSQKEGADMAISAISAMILSIHDTAWHAGLFHV